MSGDDRKDQGSGSFLAGVERARSAWDESVLKKAVAKCNLPESPTRHYTPLDWDQSNYLEKVGFPGQYPFTAGNTPVEFWKAHARLAALAGYRPDWGGRGVGRYGGFGAPEDYRDYLIRMHGQNRKGGPNMAFDLATQCGYDPDAPEAAGEVGRVGVSVSSLRDFEIIYEPYRGDQELTQIGSNFTINAPCCVIIAMYCALAEQRGIPPAALRGTPQNDILKEFIARGTYIFPPAESLRLFRDTLGFLRKTMPKLNVCSIGGYHIREAGATPVQDLAYSLSFARAYLAAGLETGLPVDDFAPMFTFNAFGGSMKIYEEIAMQRAARRMYARMLKEDFGAKSARSMLIRQITTVHVGCSSTTLQRPLNNLARAVMGGMAAGMSGGVPAAYPAFDEPLGLGHSLEAQQLQMDATRILLSETGITDVCDPWAGSYFMESLTDEMEAAAAAEMAKIEGMGGAVAAVESGYLSRAVAKSAYEKQKRVEAGEDLVVGVNCYVSPLEMTVEVNRQVEATYDPALMATAEERRIKAMADLKRERNTKAVAKALSDLALTCRDPERNVMPEVLAAVKAYATLQEICDVMREVFGVFAPAKL
ncbi:MAG: methylmalonyl-CoA mutase family protein [Thermodesulfobacteriota bacterium]